MKIGVIGCGYIGMELILFLSKKGYSVTAITQSHKKLKTLNKICKKSIIFNPQDENELFNILENHDTLIISTLFDHPDEYDEFHLQLAQMMKSMALRVSSPKKIIYTSTCNLYDENQGQWVDETAPLLNEEYRTLIETEETFSSLTNLGWDVSILRLGEVYGPSHEISQIIKSLHDHTLPGQGQNYTNMVHLYDIIGVINYILNHNLTGIYNLVDDDHSQRKELYDQVCEKYHLPLIKWAPTHKSIEQHNKRVSNHKIKAAGYNLSFPQRLLI